MIVSLVKTASELEVYAHEFEVSCNNLDQLLRPMFALYTLESVGLPLPVPLTAYPLDFQAPEGMFCIRSNCPMLCFGCSFCVMIILW